MRSKFTYTIQYGDVDATRHIRLCDLERYILEAAGSSAAAWGLGTDYVLRTYNCAWVLTRLSVQMDYLPMYNDEMVIETWIEGNAHMLSLRNYHIYIRKDNENFLIGKAASVWTMLNLDTRLVQTEAYNDPAWDGKIDGTKVDLPRAPRLGRIEQPYSTLPHQIHYSDLDFNNHCNSSKYLQFMLNAEDSLTGVYPVRFDINYAKEVHKGEHTTIQTQRICNNTASDAPGAPAPTISEVRYCLLSETDEVSCTGRIVAL